MDYIKAHVNERPRIELAKRLGISYPTLQRYVRLYGGEKQPVGTKSKVDAQKIAELYPVMTVAEIAKELGISCSTVHETAKRLNLQRTPAVERRMKEFRIAMLRKAKLPEYEAKRHESWRRLRRMEEWRVRSGLPQKSKFRVSVVPRRVAYAISYLKRKYNYFQVEGGSSLYYDSQTRRCDNEPYFTERYNIKFEKTEDEEQE